MKQHSKFAASWLGATALSLVALPMAAMGSASAQQETMYYVHVKTMDKDGAGTDADVYVKLTGLFDETEEKLLDFEDVDDHEQNDARWYKIATRKDLGRLLSVTLAIGEPDPDNPGKRVGKTDDGWSPGYVYVVTKPMEQGTVTWPQADAWYEGKKVMTGDFYRFIFDEELDADSGARMTSIVRESSRHDEALKAANNIRKIDLDGRWQRIEACSGSRCDGIKYTVTSGVERGTSSSKAQTVGMAISATVGASATVGGSVGLVDASGTVSSSVTAEARADLTNEVAESFKRTETVARESGCKGEAALYQWISSARVEFHTGTETIDASTFETKCVAPNVRPTTQDKLDWNPEEV